MEGTGRLCSRRQIYEIVGDVWLSVGWSGREAEAARGSQCIYVAVQVHAAQSFKKHRRPCLVEVPSFRPSHVPWTTPAGSSMLLNLVRWNPALHRLRLRKFRMGASTRLAAGH